MSEDIKMGAAVRFRDDFGGTRGLMAARFIVASEPSLDSQGRAYVTLEMIHPGRRKTRLAWVADLVSVAQAQAPTFTPAQERALAVIDKSGAAFVGCWTQPSANTVSNAAVQALVRKGVVRTAWGADGIFAERV